jgi:hypothetical protein
MIEKQWELFFKSKIKKRSEDNEPQIDNHHLDLGSHAIDQLHVSVILGQLRPERWENVTWKSIRHLRLSHHGREQPCNRNDHDDQRRAAHW